MSNRRFNTLNDRSYVVTQSLKQLKKHLKEWALDCKGWHITNDPKVYDLSKIDDEKYYDTVFFKERWINENGMEQRLIVNYSPEIAEHISRSLDNEKIHEEECYDGFSAVCTTIDDPASMIVSINSEVNTRQKR